MDGVTRVAGLVVVARFPTTAPTKAPTASPTADHDPDHGPDEGRSVDPPGTVARWDHRLVVIACSLRIIVPVFFFSPVGYAYRIHPVQ